MDYASLVLEKNPEGTGSYISVIPVEDLTTIATPVDAPASVEEIGVIPTAHVVAAGKNFIKIPFNITGNELTSESVGDYLGAGGKLPFKGFVPSITKAINGTLTDLKYKHLIVLVPLMDGKVIQLGSELLPASMKANFQAGDPSGTQRGYNVEISAYGDVVFYEGAISYTPAT